MRIDGYSRWRATADVAQRFQDGRVFIIGDAAHLMPPNGGFGGNTGIHDAHNLAWKLAQVIRGHAHSAPARQLRERAAAGGALSRSSRRFSRYVARTAPWLAATQKTDPLAHDFDIEIGYLYGRDAVHADPRTTRGMPGSRLPHYWLERGGARLSTLDLTGRWLLLAGPEGRNGRAAAKAAAQSLANLPMDAWQVGAHLSDPAGQFTTSVGISATGAILVRPDGFVAWRSESRSAPIAEAALRAALGHSLAH